ncbi:helix-turn-helix domain-containing protein [Nocardioides sp. BGMRC 2183]|nr:helix-turn-helix domain-containing protein [Nocardioides sp. BGMRC 2183]
MDTTDTNQNDRPATIGEVRSGAIEQILTLSQLCDHLHVSAQTIYDLRCQGRGPHGFRVGRELRFRVSEVEAWLERLEHDDACRHDVGAR